MNDCASPERQVQETNEATISRGIKLNDVMHEITNQINQLNKQKGADVIGTKKNAKAKLLTTEEINTLTNDTHEYLIKVLNDTRQKGHMNYPRTEITKVRNSLIIIGTIRIGRRSLEMTQMTLSEVQEAEAKEVDGSIFYLVEVKEQKNNDSGEPAVVPFEEKEFQLLKIYIKDLRPKIVDDKFCEVVFPAYEKFNSNPSNDLSLPAVLKVSTSLCLSKLF